VRTVRRGRPLDGSRDECILSATIELLSEQGYDKVTVKDIAERAGAGLGAIYRRWPTKVAVVVAALRAEDDRLPPPRSGDTAEDLTRALMWTFDRMEHRIPGFVSAMQREEELARAVRETLVFPKQREFADILASVFDDPDECVFRAELALGLPLHRLVLGMELPDEHEIRSRLVPVLLGRALEPPAVPAPSSRSGNGGRVVR
jgi:AcrR family transcriptional regulator